MLMLLSPSKTQDFESALPPNIPATTQPELLTHSATLVKQLRALDETALGELMGISPKLAALNVARFQHWHTPFTPENARPCLFAFQGDVYDGLEATSLSPAHWAQAQQHLRILSGLYGVLRPLDLIQPYRLEMGTPLVTPKPAGKGKHLYAFWGAQLATTLRKAADDAGTDTILNLASQEYSSAVDAKALGLRIISPEFKEEKGNTLRILGLFAKRARGLMVRHLLMTDPTDTRALHGFTLGGYRFRPDLSTETTPVFTRPQPAAKAA